MVEYQKLIAQASNPVLILDIELDRVITCNSLAVSFFQSTQKMLLKESMLGLSSSNIQTKEDIASFKLAIGKSLAGDNPEINWVFMNHKGDHIPCKIRLIRISPFDKKIVRITILDRQITQNNSSILYESNESEKLFRSIVHDQNEMIVRWTIGGIRTFANRAYCDFFDLNEQEVLGSTFFELIDDSDKDRVINELKSLTPENPFRSGIHQVKLKGGGVGWQEWSDRAFFDSNGNVTSFQSVGRDITNEIRTRIALEESEERYKALFDQQFQYSAVLDLDGKVMQANKEMIDMGFHGQDFLNKSFFKTPICSGLDENNKRISDYIEELLNAKTSNIVSFEFSGPNSETRYAKASLQKIKNGSGNPINILFQAIDVTKIELIKKKLEEERSKSQIELTDAVITAEEKERQKIGRELHDNIIQVLTAALIFLKNAASKEIREDHPCIDEVNNLIQSAIQELRNLSHSMISPFMETYGLRDALSHLIQIISNFDDLKIESEISDINEKLFSDKLKLTIYRIVQEQFNNIIKHANAHKVHFILKELKNSIWVQITDDGVGFDVQNKMDGIGLLNIKSRASLFDGEVMINSSPGAGCDMIVKLNLK